MIAAMLMQQLLNGVVVGSVYALFALGFTLLFGVNHIMNMAHGSVVHVGAFAGLYAVTVLDAPIYVALLIGMLAGGLVPVALDLFAFRPLRAAALRSSRPSCRRSAPTAEAAGAGAEAVEHGRDALPFDAFPVVIYTIGGVRMQLQLVIVALVVAMVFGLGLGTSTRHRLRPAHPLRGLFEQTSRRLGINPGPVNMQVFLISGALAGMAGVLIGLVFNSVHFRDGRAAAAARLRDHHPRRAPQHSGRR